MDKVRQIAEHINMIQEFIPQVQTRFMFGLDSDCGSQPFELTKRFIDLAPAAYPACALLSVYGQGVKNNVIVNLIEDNSFSLDFVRSVHTPEYSTQELYMGELLSSFH